MQLYADSAKQKYVVDKNLCIIAVSTLAVEWIEMDPGSPGSLLRTVSTLAVEWVEISKIQNCSDVSSVSTLAVECNKVALEKYYIINIIQAYICENDGST